MNSYVAPKFNLEAFNCPFCNAYAHMTWTIGSESAFSDYTEAKCHKCHKKSLWRKEEHFWPVIGTITKVGYMIYPDTGNAPFPAEDMPEDVRVDYMEAASIFRKSHRGGAALLRLALQKLLKHLGQEGKNINEDIRALAQNSSLPTKVIQVADTLRITGNNAVHPGTMSDEDFDGVAEKMFDLINFIVRKAITEPKELDELYLKVPESARKSAEMQDAKNAAKAQVGVK